MVTRALILLTVVAAARSASVGEHVTCCGPTEWEAIAMASTVYGHESASSMSGKLSVDHNNKLAALSLLRKMNPTSNTTLVMSAIDSSIYIYFIAEHRRQAEQEQQPQPQCVAYVLENIISDLSSSCFPAKQSSMSDRLKSQAPMNVLAYEYAGLAGLFMVQIAANADDCSPTMFSMSTGASDGPQLNVMLSNVNSGKSDQSGDKLVQVACSNVAPMRIMVPDNGRFSSRRGSMDSMRSMNNADPQQWIADMVAMYIIQMIGADVSARNKRDLRDMMMAQNEMSQPSGAEILKSAMAMKYMMQNMSDFMRPVSQNTSVNNSVSVDNMVDWMIVQDIIASLMSRKSQDDSRDDDSSIDSDDVMSWMAKQKLVSRRQKQDLSDIVYEMLERKMITNLMSGDGTHDTSDDQSSDGNDGSDTYNILINQRITSSEDTVTSEDNTREDGSIQAVMSWFIEQKLIPAMALAGAKSQDDSENSRMSSMVKKSIMSSMMNSNSRKNGQMRHKRDLRDMVNKRSQPSRDDALSMDDVVSWMMQELMPTMTPNFNDSRKLDLWDVIALMHKMSEPSHDESENDDGQDSGRDEDDSISFDDLVAWMIKQEIMSSLTHASGRSNGPLDMINQHRKPSHSDRSQSDDNINIGDILTWMIKQKIMSNMMSSQGHKDGPQRHKRDLEDMMALVNKQDDSNHGPSRDDGSINIDDIISWMIKQEIMSNMMPSKGPNDGSQRHKRDLWDMMALMNKKSKSNHGQSHDDNSSSDGSNDDSRDNLSRDDADRSEDSSKMDELIAFMIKQSLMPKHKSH